MTDITTHVTTNMNTQARNAQDLEMLYQFLLCSATNTFQMKLMLHQEDFQINGDPMGLCLFKKMVQLTYIDTMVTASPIRERDTDGDAPQVTYVPIQHQEIQ